MDPALLAQREAFLKRAKSTPISSSTVSTPSSSHAKSTKPKKKKKKSSLFPRPKPPTGHINSTHSFLHVTCKSLCSVWISSVSQQKPIAVAEIDSWFYEGNQNVLVCLLRWKWLDIWGV